MDACTFPEELFRVQNAGNLCCCAADSKSEPGLGYLFKPTDFYVLVAAVEYLLT